MKNIFKITALLFALQIVFNIQSFCQPVFNNPQGDQTSDCKTQIVDPEINFTYPPDDPGDGGGDNDDEEEDDNYQYKEKRRVMFVHGYKGDVPSWSKAATYLDNLNKEKVLVFNLMYVTKGMTSLDEVATQIKSTNLNPITVTDRKENMRNFFIAHSMGGMALRYMQNKYSPNTRPYGGIITVGSGHQGIYAASTKIHRSKKYEDFLIESCATHLEPKIIAQIPKIGLQLNSIFELFSIGGLTKSACKGGIGVASEFLLDEDIDPYLTIEHLQYDYPSTLDVEHKIAMYGVEEDDGEYIVTKKVKSNFGTEHQLTVQVDGLVLPKFIGSVINSPNSFKAWEAGQSDDKGLKFWSEVILSYTANKDFSKQYASNFWNQFFRPNEVTKHVLLRNAYNRALIWMRDANFQYNELIGGIQNVTVNSDYCRCKIQTSYNHYSYMNQIYNGNCDELVGTYINGYLIHESYRLLGLEAEKFDTDGFVTANSARAMPGADESIRLRGSGHFQMRNDLSLKREFENLFGTESTNAYFKLAD